MGRKIGNPFFYPEYFYHFDGHTMNLGPQGTARLARFFAAIWLLSCVVTPLLIFPMTRGKGDGGTIGFRIAGAGCLVLLVSSIVLAKTTVGQYQEVCRGRAFLLFICGLIVGVAVFFVGCGVEMKRVLGH